MAQMKRSIIDVVGEFFAPLILAFESKEQLSAFVSDLGWKIEWNDTQEALIKELMNADDLLEDLEGIWSSYEAEGKVTEALAVEALDLVGTVFDTVQNFTAPANRGQITQLPPPLSTPEEWDDLLLALPGYLVTRWLQINAPVVYEIGFFTGVIDEEERPDLPPRPVMDWAAWGTLFSDPETMVKERFGWGQSFDGDAFLYALGRLMRALGLGAYAARIEDTVGEVQDALNSELRVPLVPDRLLRQTGGLQPELLFGLIKAQNGPVPEGLRGSLLVNGPGEFNVPLTEEWALVLASPALDMGEIASFSLRRNGVEVTTTAPQAAVDIGFEGAPADPAEPWRVFGGDSGPRLEASEFAAGVSFAAGSPPDLGFRLSTKTRIVISPGEGDGFIAEILGDNDMTIDAGIAMRWSNTNGFAFEGGVGFDVVIPVDVKLGPIFLTQVRVGLEGGSEGLTVEGAVTGGLDISVLAVSVDDIGLRASVIPVEEGERGLLGPVDLKLGFKPPTGLGMVIDAAGVVTGGGYLYHDEDLSEYGGVAEIGFLSLKLSAIGILTTRMPDGEEGWSLFLAVFSEFPPIQLAFGFTLNGVGGLVGLHRTFDDEALRERLLAGALDSIMFPQDPVANAPQIISDIRAVFPPSQGQFVFGAMLKFGWGTPSIVSLELGVIVELPDPIKIALLGQLGMILPKPDATLIEINMDMFGVANLTEGTIALDAVIRDSHIMHLITLSGAMAFRAIFGGRPSMLLSIGGFHPDFEPPPNVPKLGRMKAALPLGKYAAVELSGYVAVTSNTFQTGGSVDIWVKVSGLSAEGWFKFDALIQFSPFGFVFTVEIGFSVSFKSATLMGVDVWLSVKGPAPWTLDGYAQVKILGFKKKLNVDLELGKKTKVAVPRYDVLAELEDALKQSDAWSVGGADEAPLVAYAKRSDGSVVFDPKGSIGFAQTVVPLLMRIEKFGNGSVEGPDQFELDWIRAGDSDAAFEYTDEWFARGEFIEMDEDARLAAPSFVEFEGGARIRSPGEELGASIDCEEGFEEIIVDPEANRREQKKVEEAAQPEKAKPREQVSAMKAQPKEALVGIPSMRVRKLTISDGLREKPASAAGPRVRKVRSTRAMKSGAGARPGVVESAMVKTQGAAALKVAPAAGRRGFR